MSFEPEIDPDLFDEEFEEGNVDAYQDYDDHAFDEEDLLEEEE